MKALLVIGLLALLMIAPGVAADDDPVCGDSGLKGCVMDAIPCNPFYHYFENCAPQPGPLP